MPKLRNAAQQQKVNSKEINGYKKKWKNQNYRAQMKIIA